MPDIDSVNLRAIDLNLLVVVAAVLEERSVSRAASRLHLTQGAVSSAMKRASALFPQPLVERAPHGVVRTPTGEALLPELAAWLEAGRSLLSAGPGFEPATTRRRFVVACTDVIATRLLPDLLRVLRRRAPEASLDVVTIERAREGLEQGRVDLIVGIPRGLGAGFDGEVVWEDPYACLVRPERAQLSLDEYCVLPHVELALFGEPDRAVDHALAAVGRTRHVAVASPHFSSLPVAMLEVDGVVTLGASVAAAFARLYGARVVPSPVSLPALVVRQVWHRRAARDAGHGFLRAAVREAVSAFRGPESGPHGPTRPEGRSG